MADLKLSDPALPYLPSGGILTTDLVYVVRGDGASPEAFTSYKTPVSELLGDVLQPGVPANLTAGFTSTAFNAGTKSSGTFTPDPDNGNLQRAVNGGAHTLAPPAVGSGDALTMIIQYTNNASAGAITTSGFTAADTAAYNTTNGNDFMFDITVINGFSRLVVTALQ